jgi:hypothetical protein
MRYERLRAPPLLSFTALSLALHAAGFVAVRHGAGGASVPSFEDRSQSLVGETLDIDPPALAPRDDEPARNGTTPDPAAAAPRRPSIRGRLPLASAAPASAPAPLFGAVGVPFATDLATGFTRAFPQAASADPNWFSLPFGSAGRAEVALVLDDDGRLASSEIEGSPSVALRTGIERTLVLLARRQFTARAPLTRLRIVARLSRDDVHDGLHGDFFALSAGSFAGDVGAAFFALPAAAGPGRRVDLEMRLLP